MEEALAMGWINPGWLLTPKKLISGSLSRTIGGPSIEVIFRKRALSHRPSAAIKKPSTISKSQTDAPG